MNKDERLVYDRLSKYTKPVKTKHLAPRVNLDRPYLVSILNKLASKNLIKWNIPKRKDDGFYGWVKL